MAKKKKSKEFLVYGLQDPRNRHIRYVGLSTDGEKRPNEHRFDSSLKLKNHKNSWLKNLFNEGFDYIIVVLQRCDSQDEVNDAERFWVKFYRSIECLDHPLTNMTDGGEGRSGFTFSHSLETKAKMSAVKMGKKASPETKARISAAQVGKKATEETRAKMSASSMGRKQNEKTKAALALANIGRKNTPATLARMSLAQLGHRASDETKAKMSASHEGRVYTRGWKLTEETKAKMSASRMGRQVSAETRAKISETEKKTKSEKKIHG